MATKAAKMYAQRRKEIAGQIVKLESKLRHHEKRAQKDPANWGFAGDLGYVSERLTELLAFVNG